MFELHNLSTDPEARQNRASVDAPVMSTMLAVMEVERDRTRLLPRHRNP